MELEITKEFAQALAERLGVKFRERTTMAGTWTGNGWRSERILTVSNRAPFTSSKYGRGVKTGFDFSDAVGSHSVADGRPNRAVIAVEWWEPGRAEWRAMSFTSQTCNRDGFLVEPKKNRGVKRTTSRVDAARQMEILNGFLEKSFESCPTKERADGME